MLLAFAPEIHAGIVGGLIGAGSVLVGVVGTEWAIRVRERRARVAEAAAELGLLLPYVAVPISEMWTDPEPIDTGYASEWATRRDQVSRLLLRIERDARWPMRDARDVRLSAQTTLARITAMVQLWRQARSKVTQGELADLFDGVPSRATIRRGGALIDRTDDFVKQYRHNRASQNPR